MVGRDETHVSERTIQHTKNSPFTKLVFLESLPSERFKSHLFYLLNIRIEYKHDKNLQKWHITMSTFLLKL